MQISNSAPLYREMPPLTGLRYLDAIKVATNFGFYVRAAAIDGVACATDREFSYKRVNVQISDGIVVEYAFY